MCIFSLSVRAEDASVRAKDKKANLEKIENERKGWSDSDRIIYHNILSMCSLDSAQDQVESFSEMATIFSSSFWNIEIINSLLQSLMNNDIKQFNLLAKAFKMSPELKELTSSRGYNEALTRCYGNNESYKNVFFLSLLSVDISGKLIAISSDVLLVKTLYKYLIQVVLEFNFKPMHLVNAIDKYVASMLFISNAGSAVSAYIKFRTRINIQLGHTEEHLNYLLSEIEYLKLKQASLPETSENYEKISFLIFCDQNEIIKIRENLKIF
jgi:predicted transcriptional regulator